MPWLYEAIEEEALFFLKTHSATCSIPVPIEHIIEVCLEMSIAPIKGLLQSEHIDAFLSRDCTIIYIDEDHYLNQSNRSRFTLAHEVGHYVMHQSVIKKIHSIQDWKHYILGESTQRAMLENEANHFAGCLLMPQPDILDAYYEYEEMAYRQFMDAGMQLPDRKRLIAYIANKIAKKFEVSEKAAEIRLSKMINRL